MKDLTEEYEKRREEYRNTKGHIIDKIDEVQPVIYKQRLDLAFAIVSLDQMYDVFGDIEFDHLSDVQREILNNISKQIKDGRNRLILEMEG